MTRKESDNVVQRFGYIMLMLLLISSFSPLVALVGGTDVHDLAATLSNLPEKSHLASNQTLTLNATVRNIGNTTEYNVVLQLLINGSQSVSSVIDSLPVGGFYTNSYQWSPTSDGIYIITAFVPPVPAGELNTTNNNDTKLVNVCLSTPPQPNFTFSPIIAQNIVKTGNVTFNASSSSTPDWAAITWYYWNFSFTNGTLASENQTVPYTTHGFTSFGNVSVALTVGDADLLSNSTSTTLIISNYPTASFTVLENDTMPPHAGPYYVNRTLNFDASNSRGGGLASVVNCFWNFGDNSNSSTPNSTTTHTYNSSSSYSVSLTVTDSNTLNATANTTIDVRIDNPVSLFTVSPNLNCYVNQTITFNATTSYDPDNYNTSKHGINSYNWTFGDNNTLETPNPTTNYTYTSPGVYNVSLQVTSYDGLLSSPSQMTLNVTSEALLQLEIHSMEIATWFTE